MTTATPFDASSETSSFETGRARPWRVGVAEFLLVGGATLFLFPLSWWLRRTFGLDDAELAVGFLTFYGAHVINDPHFTVTYALFYQDVRERAFGGSWPMAQRVRYAVAGFVVPAALCVWAFYAITSRSAQALGWMVQLMFFLVGWHYAKQGFGVLTVLSARRGVGMRPVERTVVLSHVYAAWAFAWANPAMPARDFVEKGVVYRGLAHPRWLELLTGSALALSTLALVVVLLAKWRRERRMFPLAPFVGFLVTIWSWTIFSSADRLVQYMIPALHSLQYFYFVWLMKRNQARAEEGPPAFGRPVAVRLGLLTFAALGLGWLFFHGAPAFLDGGLASPSRGGTVTQALGPTPFFAALYVIVNVHHYFMDFVIWRRENPETRYLRA